MFLVDHFRKRWIRFQSQVYGNLFIVVRHDTPIVAMEKDGLYYNIVFANLNSNQEAELKEWMDETVKFTSEDKFEVPGVPGVFYRPKRFPAWMKSQVKEQRWFIPALFIIIQDGTLPEPEKEASSPYWIEFIHKTKDKMKEVFEELKARD